METLGSSETLTLASRLKHRDRGDGGAEVRPQLRAVESHQDERRASSSGIAVVYTKTTVVPVDVERLREERIILCEQQDGVDKAYKILRTQVLQRMRANGWRTLAVTSPSKGNGKTLTAINLAISLAREVNQTVLLADLDLIHPGIGRYFMPPGRYGLSDYLMGDVELADILIHPMIDRLVVLPGNKPFVHTSEILCSPRMTRLVHELRERYADRITLFDMPPLFVRDDVIAFLPHLDAVLLVVEEGKTTRDEVLQAQQLIGDDKIIGMVLNKSESRATAMAAPYLRL